MSLERVKRFLHQLGNPQLKLPPVIHVSGTNGKGSTIATLRALLEGTEHKVHVMTSPHLVHPTERIRLAGKLISTQALIDVLEECLEVNRTEPITFFEIFAAASYLAMSREPADYVLLETGMGGRLDATNVIPNPVCTIITMISNDHEKFLGNTLQSIAFEKAGIMKASVPCVIGHQTQEAIDAGVLKVFHKVSRSLSPNANLIRYDEDWVIEPKNNLVQFTWQGESIVVSQPNLKGTHQIYNTGAALVTYRILMGSQFDPKILSPKNPENPLWKIHWPGRLQKIDNDTFSIPCHDGSEIWIDGGHNDSAGKALAQQAALWKKQDNKPLHLIVAMVNRKDPQSFLSPLIPHATSLSVTKIKGEKTSFSALELYKKAEPLGFKSLYLAETIEDALAQIPQDCPSRILITGSLYFVGTCLK